MEAILVPKVHFDNLSIQIDEIKKIISASQKSPKGEILDNHDFTKLLKISKRTAQTWRDEGRISFSQIGSKIYYKFDDIEQFLGKNKVSTFKN
jgi:Helix-turn-helix domain